jgi:hypothetical protein
MKPPQIRLLDVTRSVLKEGNIAVLVGKVTATT